MRATIPTGAVLLLALSHAAAAQTNYVQFGNLNNAAVNVTTTWTKLNTTSTAHTFIKRDSLSNIEVHVNSRFRVGSFSGNANGIRFQVRIDNTILPTVDNMGSLLTANSSDFLSIFAVFRRLPVGTHRVSLWAATAIGSAASVIVDPGGWSGKMIVKETR